MYMCVCVYISIYIFFNFLFVIFNFFILCVKVLQCFRVSCIGFDVGIPWSVILHV